MPERRAGGAAKGLRAPVRRALTASGRFQYRPGEPSAGLKEHRPASARSPSPTTLRRVACARYARLVHALSYGRSPGSPRVAGSRLPSDIYLLLARKDGLGAAASGLRPAAASSFRAHL